MRHQAGRKRLDPADNKSESARAAVGRGGKGVRRRPLEPQRRRPAEDLVCRRAQRARRPRRRSTTSRNRTRVGPKFRGLQTTRCAVLHGSEGPRNFFHRKGWFCATRTADAPWVSVGESAQGDWYGRDLYSPSALDDLFARNMTRPSRVVRDGQCDIEKILRGDAPSFTPRLRTLKVWYVLLTPTLP